MITCRQCGAALRDGAKFCSKCGTKLEEAQYCDQCGAEVFSGDLYCASCGAKLGDSAPAKPKLTRAAAQRHKWIPDKEYITFNRIINIAALENQDQFRELQKKQLEYRQFQRQTELAESPFWKDCFVVLEDGTMVGFIQGHIQRYIDAGAEDYHFNLYRLETDGTATFLNAGIQGSIEFMYVLNGFAYCSWGAVTLRAKVY